MFYLLLLVAVVVVVARSPVVDVTVASRSEASVLRAFAVHQDDARCGRGDVGAGGDDDPGAVVVDGVNGGDVVDDDENDDDKGGAPGDWDCCSGERVTDERGGDVVTRHERCAIVGGSD